MSLRAARRASEIVSEGTRANEASPSAIQVTAYSTTAATTRRTATSSSADRDPAPDAGQDRKLERGLFRSQRLDEAAPAASPELCRSSASWPRSPTTGCARAFDRRRRSRLRSPSPCAPARSARRCARRGARSEMALTAGSVEQSVPAIVYRPYRQAHGLPGAHWTDSRIYWDGSGLLETCSVSMFEVVRSVYLPGRSPCSGQPRIPVWNHDEVGSARAEVCGRRARAHRHRSNSSRAGEGTPHDREVKRTCRTYRWKASRSACPMPVSEFGANLPRSARGSFCEQRMTMPTFLEAQNEPRAARVGDEGFLGDGLPQRRRSTLHVGVRSLRQHRQAGRQGKGRFAASRNGVSPALR